MGWCFVVVVCSRLACLNSLFIWCSIKLLSVKEITLKCLWMVAFASFHSISSFKHRCVLKTFYIHHGFMPWHFLINSRISKHNKIAMFEAFVCVLACISFVCDCDSVLIEKNVFVAFLINLFKFYE